MHSKVLTSVCDTLLLGTTRCVCRTDQFTFRRHSCPMLCHYTDVVGRFRTNNIGQSRLFSARRPTMMYRCNRLSGLSVRTWMSDDSEDQLHVLRDYTFLEREISSSWKPIASLLVPKSLSIVFSWMISTNIVIRVTLDYQTYRTWLHSVYPRIYFSISVKSSIASPCVRCVRPPH